MLSFLKRLRSFAVLVIADLFHPIHGLAVELFLYGDMRHGGGRGGTVPVLFAGWEPDDVARADFFDGSSPPLNPATACGDNQGLTERVRGPGGASAGLE